MKALILLAAGAVSLSATGSSGLKVRPNSARALAKSITVVDNLTSSVSITSPAGMSRMGTLNSLPLEELNSRNGNNVATFDAGTTFQDYASIPNTFKEALDPQNGAAWKSAFLGKKGLYDAFLYKHDGTGYVQSPDKYYRQHKFQGAFFKMSYTNSALNDKTVSMTFNKNVSSIGTYLGLDLFKDNAAGASNPKIFVHFDVKCFAFKTAGTSADTKACKSEAISAAASSGDKFTFDTDDNDYRNFVIGMMPYAFAKGGAAASTISAGDYGGDLTITFTIG